MTREKIQECREKGIPSLMVTECDENNDKVSARTAFACMKKGDAAAKEDVDTYIDYLGCGISNIINIFQPEVLSIGGGVSGEGNYLLDMLIPLLSNEVYGKGIVKGTDIRIAALGNDAGIIGGAVLGLK
jgi:glucokinase